MENNNKIRTSIFIKPDARVFIETLATWILLFYLIINIAITLKFFDIIYKYNEYIGFKQSLESIYVKIQNTSEELEVIYQSISIYKIFAIILVLILIGFIIYRIIRKQYVMLFKLNIILIFFTILFSGIFLRILLFIENIILIVLNNDIQNTSSEIIKNDLFENFQKILDMKDILIIVFLTVLIFNILAIVINISEIVSKNEKMIYRKITLTVFILSIVSFINLIYKVEDKIHFYHEIYFNKGIMISYQIENKKIIPKLEFNLKPISYQILNEGIRRNLNSVNIESVISGKYIYIKGLSGFESNVIIGNNYQLKVANKKYKFGKTFILDNFDKLDEESTIRLMKKYDFMYISGNESSKGEFYNDKYNNVYYVYSIKNYKLDMYYINKKSLVLSDKSYIVIPLGRVFVNEKNETKYYENLIHHKDIYTDYSNLIFDSYNMLKEEYINRNNLKKIDK